MGLSRHREPGIRELMDTSRRMVSDNVRMIMALYVDDLIFMENNSIMVEE
jgi:hypothetical protein